MFENSRKQSTSLNRNPLTLGVVHVGIGPSSQVPYKLSVVRSISITSEPQVARAVEVHLGNCDECRRLVLERLAVEGRLVPTAVQSLPTGYCSPTSLNSLSVFFTWVSEVLHSCLPKVSVCPRFDVEVE